MRMTVISGWVALCASVLAGCGQSSSPSSTASAGPRAGTLPPSLILTQAPADALDVVAAKKKAQPGETVVVRGRIGGRAHPFVENRGIFVLVDAGLPTCADNPGDGCKTPWDYCCEPPDHLAARSLTVQIPGPDGKKPLQADVQGQAGLAPMATVVIRGEVAEKPDEKTMILRATGIYVEPPRPPRS